MRAFGPSAHALFVTVGHSRPGRGGNGMRRQTSGCRRQPVFGPRAGARADVTAPGSGVQARRLAGLLRPTQEQHKSGSRRHPTRG